MKKTLILVGEKNDNLYIRMNRLILAIFGTIIEQKKTKQKNTTLFVVAVEFVHYKLHHKFQKSQKNNKFDNENTHYEKKY